MLIWKCLKDKKEPSKALQMFIVFSPWTCYVLLHSIVSTTDYKNYFVSFALQLISGCYICSSSLQHILILCADPDISNKILQT